MAEIIGGTCRPSTSSAGSISLVTSSQEVASTSSQEVASSCKKAKTAWTTKLKEFDAMTPEQRAEALGSDEGFCVAEDITLEDFHKKCDEVEQGAQKKGALIKPENRWCFRMEFRDEKAWIYELPHTAHDTCAAQVIQELTAGVFAHRRDFLMASSPRCDNNNGANSFEPDGSIRESSQRPGAGNPGAADASGNRFPNIIVEVAFNESMPHVRRKAVDWLNASNNPTFAVQQVIVIKIGADTCETCDDTRHMEAWRYEQAVAPAVNHYDNVAEHYNFGVPLHAPPPPYNNLGVTFPDQMVLQVPTASFYYPANPPAGMPASIPVDLLYIRQAIQRSFD